MYHEQDVQRMLKIFCRSEGKHGLVYEIYLGDGDSKSYHTVANAGPFTLTLISRSWNAVVTSRREWGGDTLTKSMN